MNSLNNLLKGKVNSEAEFLSYWAELAFCGDNFAFEIKDLEAINFRDYVRMLHDFFDSKDIIVTIRTSSDFKFVPIVQDKSLYGHGGNKTKIYSRHGLKSREEAEYIAFKKAFEYLEKKYE